MAEPIIQFKNVSVVYEAGKTTQTRALSDVTLDIYPEEYIVVFGPSGSGKSTLLYAVAGLESPGAGEVYISGQNIANLSEEAFVNFHQQKIGMIFQAYYLLSSLNALDNVLLPQMFRGVEREERKKRALALMERFGIKGFANRPPQRLSGGQQQRVAISRALINDPDIILADEPVGNLDSKSAEEVMKILQELNEKDRKTIILITHDPRFISYAHRVFHLKDGMLVSVSINPAKPQKAVVTEAPAGMERLRQIAPGLTDAQLRARSVIGEVLQKYDAETVLLLENLVTGFLEDTLSQENMEAALSRASAEGGLGLYHETALNLSHKLADIKSDMKRAAYLPPTGDEDLVLHLRQDLLQDYGGTLDLQQMTRLDRLIRKFLAKEIDSSQLREILRWPLKKGGVGLSWRTSRNFSRKLSILNQ